MASPDVSELTANCPVSQLMEGAVWPGKHTCPVQPYLWFVDQIQQPLQPLVLQSGPVHLLLVVYYRLLNEAVDVHRRRGQSLRQEDVEWLKRAVCHLSAWPSAPCVRCVHAVPCSVAAFNKNTLSTKGHTTPYCNGLCITLCCSQYLNTEDKDCITHWIHSLYKAWHH